MGKNLIPIIAKELGVEIGEIFRIEQSDYFYRFSKERLERRFPTGCEWNESTMTIGNLQYAEIVKLPYEPKYGDLYWTYWREDFSVIRDYWRNTTTDYAFKLAGIVFRTQGEALEARPAKYKELTGKEWEE